MSDALNALQTAVTGFAPRVIGAALLLILALLAARLLQRVGVRFLRRIGLDDLFERTGTVSSLRRVGLSGSASVVLGYVIFWGVVLAGFAAALSILGLSSLQQNTDLLVVFAGKILIAALILAIGLAAAGWLSNLIASRADEAGLSGGNIFRQTVFIAIIVIAGLVAAAQLGLQTSLLMLLILVVLASAGLVAGLALGFGLAPLSGNIAAGRYVRGNDIAVGDEISVNGVEGTIEKMSYASVILRSPEGDLHHIPNRLLLEGIVTSKARREPER